MPPKKSPRRALPARFRRPRVLIVGCGDVGQRLVRQWQVHTGTAGGRGPRVLALTSSPEKAPALQALGAVPLLGNLDDVRTLARLAGVASYVVHLAPPAPRSGQDSRTRHLLRVLARRAPKCVVYGSTTGVYGDCGGQWVDETRALAPSTERARRRVDAEQQVRRFGLETGCRVQVLRIPGIYAPDREGGTPRGRLLKGLPVLHAADDVFTNHIHADDLARAVQAALWHGKPQRTYHVSDDTELRMGDYFDFAADLYGLPRPERMARAQAMQCLPAVMLSFMNESRRLRNTRLRKELKVRLRWPTVHSGLAAGE